MNDAEAFFNVVSEDSTAYKLALYVTAGSTLLVYGYVGVSHFLADGWGLIVAVCFTSLAWVLAALAIYYRQRQYQKLLIAIREKYDS